MRVYFNRDDLRMAKKLEEIRQRLTRARAGVPRGAERFFTERARLRAVHAASTLDGAAIEEDAVFLSMSGETTAAASPDQARATNIADVYGIIEQLALDPALRIDEGIARSVNALLLRDVAGGEARGHFRPVVKKRAAVGAAGYQPPDAREVPGLMEDFAPSVSAWSATYPGAVVASLSHAYLLSVQPFVAGNTLTSQLIMELVLNATNFAAGGMAPVAPSLLAMHAEYEAAVRETVGIACSDDVDATPLVDVMLRGLLAASLRFEHEVDAFARSLEAWRGVAQGTLNARQEAGLLCIVHAGRPLSSNSYARMTGASQSSAINDLSDLSRRGFVVREGVGKATRYRAADEVATWLRAPGEPAAEPRDALHQAGARTA